MITRNQTIAYGDTGLYIICDIAPVTGTLTGTIVAATLKFTGPHGQSFERSAELLAALRVGYSLTVADWMADRFDERGTWSVDGTFNLSGGRTRSSLNCAPISIV